MDVANQPIKAKLFAGFLMTSEIRMHLNKSPAWQNAQLTPDENSCELVEMRYGEGYSIGRYLAEEQLALSEIKDYEIAISQKLQEYCPKLETGHLKFYIYSQIFIY
ncbi:MAG: hypothetical protein H0T62_09775 [Parachlamydiaceae bacterium]|nr:hypothetical protein [Parachlamydiaceae bacterium]